MKRIIPILIAILICFSVGCTASYFQSESILNWYPALEKPSCTPPDIAFPIAWSFIYLCMGHFLLLFSESVARFCKYSGAGCACYLLYDRKLSGEEIFGISFCSLSFVVASCHLS